jgi:hypothetical protein
MPPKSYYELGEEFSTEYGEEFDGEVGAESAPANLVRRDPRVEDVTLMGPVTTIAAAANAIIQVNPKLVFRAHRLMFGAGVAMQVGDAVLVHSIDIAAREQILSRDPLPGCVFGPDATHKLSGNVMCPGNGASIRVSNNSLASLTIQPIFTGESAPTEMPEEAARAMLRASRGADVMPARGEGVEDLLAATEPFDVPDDGTPVSINFRPKMPIRPRRAMIVDCVGGTWPYPAPPSGSIEWQSFQVATKEQLIGNDATGVDAWVFQPQATLPLKGSIIRPAAGADLVFAAGPTPQEGPMRVRVVFFGPSGDA